MIIGGLDVGTTGCKLSVYDEKGNFVYNSYKEYEVSRISGEHEIDASKIFDAVCDVLKDVAQKYEIEAMGITTFGETFTVLDEKDIGANPAEIGLKGSPTKVVTIFPPPIKGGGEKIVATGADAAKAIVDFLTKKGLVKNG